MKKHKMFELEKNKIKSKLFLIMGFLISLNLFSQNWDFLNYPNTNLYTFSNGACIDSSDNIFHLESTPANLYQVSKYFDGLQVVTSLPLPSTLSFEASTYNHITCANNSIYLAGVSSTNGVIYEVDSNLTSSNILSTVTSSNGWVNFKGISIYNNEIIVVGNLSINWPATNSSISYGTLTPLIINQPTSFVAKYSLVTNQWIWVKKIIGSGGGYVSSEDVVIDQTGKIYITGKFKNSLTLYDDLNNPHTVSSTNENNYLLRLLGNGGYDTTWGVKQNYFQGNTHKSFDVKVDDSDNSVYYISGDKILKHSTTGIGNLTWTKVITAIGYGGAVISQITLNNCEEIYATGTTGTSVNRGVCGHTYFSVGANKITGITTNNWVSNSTGSESKGTSILLDSNDKLHITGSFGYVSSCSQFCSIDNNQASTTYSGIFLGRIDDANYNSCCPLAKAVASFVNPYQIVQMNSKYGSGDVAILCLSDDLLVDGSLSTCETGYLVELAEFDLSAWVDINVIYSTWINPLTQAPNNIDITKEIKNGYQLKPNKVYRFKLAVGDPWDATHIFFKIYCCSEEPKIKK